ncbi:sigma factor [uncultured Polaribacter sp.]|uniref:RNA polymerase sigma factor n=1 Tax=uncultured Polaribacter sp. TaxID=174711 RepID=UPI002614FE1C|nr:sigma factor [uncultured Polaribacter sp.]
MKLSDAQILKNLKEGSPDAYKQLFDRYYKPLSVYAFKYCDSFQLAEDIVQDLFIKLWDEKRYLKLENAKIKRTNLAHMGMDAIEIV